MKKLFALLTLTTFLMFGALSVQNVTADNFQEEIVLADKDPKTDNEKDKKDKKDAKKSKSECKDKKVSGKCCDEIKMKECKEGKKDPDKKEKTE